MLNKILFLNIFIFSLIHILNLFIDINFEEIRNLLGISSEINEVIKTPWVIISYMFLHLNIFHLISNMIFLYFFGKLFLKYLSNTKLFSNYILGGLTGGVFFMLFSNFTSLQIESEPLIGSSASILSILVTCFVFTPNYSFKTFKNSEKTIKLKYLAIIFIIYSIVNPLYTHNIGGLISHLGGIAYGILYMILIKKEINVGFFIEKVLEISFSKEKKIKRRKNEDDYEYNTRKKINELELNKILDKISKSGFKSLSKKEKKILEKFSQN